eukprot:GILK01003829.1.p1 GENE.GILK01003829.1~~GILK01003829.1.p1  ORF type:complete len:349 (-),score=23.51 GILK01003829.1:279-1325(-)
MEAVEDFYAVLQIPVSASNEDIKQAYRKLSKQWHPDKNKGSEESSNMMAKINEAQFILSDPSRRQKYDAQRLSSKTSAHQPGDTGPSNDQTHNLSSSVKATADFLGVNATVRKNVSDLEQKLKAKRDKERAASQACNERSSNTSFHTPAASGYGASFSAPPFFQGTGHHEPIPPPGTRFGAPAGYQFSGGSPYYSHPADHQPYYHDDFSYGHKHSMSAQASPFFPSMNPQPHWGGGRYENHHREDPPSRPSGQRYSAPSWSTAHQQEPVRAKFCTVKLVYKTKSREVQVRPELTVKELIAQHKPRAASSDKLSLTVGQIIVDLHSNFTVEECIAERQTNIFKFDDDEW